ncbi:MAG: hypothetical protein H0V76_10560, partial [Blastocatellia bacterium]|nr:hypothetical protein [Blastocatellia bacterium]
MKRFISGLFLLVMIAFAGNVAFAQGNGVAETRVVADKGNGAARVKMPFAEGETFTYEGKLKRMLLTIPVGEMTFTVGPQFGSSAFTVNAEAVSKGTLLRILRFSFLQRFDSTIDAVDVRTLRTVK